MYRIRPNLLNFFKVCVCVFIGGGGGHINSVIGRVVFNVVFNDLPGKLTVYQFFLRSTSEHSKGE